MATPPPWGATLPFETLLRVKLDDQLFGHGNRDRFAGRGLEHTSGPRLAVEREPLGHALSLALLEGAGDHAQVRRLLAHRDDVPRTRDVRRDRHLLAVHRDVAVTHDLA